MSSGVHIGTQGLNTLLSHIMSCHDEICAYNLYFDFLYNLEFSIFILYSDFSLHTYRVNVKSLLRFST